MSLPKGDKREGGRQTKTGIRDKSTHHSSCISNCEVIVSYSTHGCWACPLACRAMSPLTCWKRRSPPDQQCWSGPEGDTPKSQLTSTPIQSCGTCSERKKRNSRYQRLSVYQIILYCLVSCANIQWFGLFDTEGTDCEIVTAKHSCSVFMVCTITYTRICRWLYSTWTRTIGGSKEVFTLKLFPLWTNKHCCTGLV